MQARTTILVALWLGMAVPGLSTHVSAQSSNYVLEPSQRNLPDTAWNRLIAPPAYPFRSTHEGVQPLVKEKPYKPSLLAQIIQAIISFFSTTTGLVVLWSVLLGIIAYIVWRVFLKDGRFSFRGAKKLDVAADDPDEADLQNTSWLRLMDEAVAKSNLRAAVRYGYLHLLQALAERDLIHYRPGKTNSDYAAELAGTAGTSGAISTTDFRTVSRSYEYTWYGSYPITAPQFDAYRAQILAIQNSQRG